MSKNKKKKATTPPPRPQIQPIDVVASLVPAAFLAGIRTFAAPCGGGHACTMAGHILFGMGVAAMALVLMRLFGADKATKRSFDLILVIVGLLLAFLPGGPLALCTEATMTCRAITLPFARVCGIALALGAFGCELTTDYEERGRGRRRRR